MLLGWGDVSKAMQLQEQELLGKHRAYGRRKQSPEVVAPLNGLDCRKVCFASRAGSYHISRHVSSTGGRLGKKETRNSHMVFSAICMWLKPAISMKLTVTILKLLLCRMELANVPNAHPLQTSYVWPPGNCLSFRAVSPASLSDCKHLRPGLHIDPSLNLP